MYLNFTSKVSTDTTLEVKLFRVINRVHSLIYKYKKINANFTGIIKIVNFVNVAYKKGPEFTLNNF